MKSRSKNIILYRGRYIRRLVGSGWAAECYVVTWAKGPELCNEAQTWYGCLKKLFKQIAYDDKFFGERRWLV